MKRGELEGYHGEEVFIPSNKSKMNLTITKEKVLAAAAKCSTAKETLKTLFPEVFEDDGLIVLDEDSIGGYILAKGSGDHVLGVAISFAPAGLEGKCIFLSENYRWEVREGYGNNGHTILIPRRK